MTIEVGDDTVRIDDYETEDVDVVKYFEELDNQQKNLEDELGILLKLGVVAAKAGSVGLSTDYVDKEMTKLQEHMTDSINEQFGEKGAIPEFLKEHFGVDGLIVVDLPWPENKNFAKKCKKNSINFVQLISPTTSKYRINKIIKDSHDMIYYISMLSTTGGKLKVSPRKILENYNKIKRINKSKNLVIGFGITIKTISSLKKADGLVVGSALCKKISESIKNRQNPVTNVGNMVRKLKDQIT